MNTLPEPIASYLAADKAKDANGVAACFNADATVHDEGHEYRGISAIKAWKEGTNAKYDYLVEPLNVAVKGDSVKLHARLTGNFPSSPAELDYTFVLAHDKITALSIG